MAGSSKAKAKAKGASGKPASANDSKSDSKGWKKVEVDNDFLLGLTEPGFQDMEELDGATLIDGDLNLKELIAKADAELGIGKDTAKPAKTKKTKKEKIAKKDAPAGDTCPEANSPASLKRRIAELEAENARLTSPAAKKPKESKAEKAASKADATPAKAATSAGPADGTKKKKKLNKRQKKAIKAKAAAAALANGEQPDIPVADEKPREKLDMSAWDDYGLSASIVEALETQSFTAPTPIQHECLPAAIVGHADIIGAAQTGSGKTLAFGLPVINYLVQEAVMQRELEETVAANADPIADTPALEPTATAEATDMEVDSADDDEGMSQDENEGAEGSDKDEASAEEPVLTGNAAKIARLQRSKKMLRALILCPTRELAMQVCNHLQVIGKAVDVRVAPIVGGISPQKQERLLSYRPAVVVATPGRLWDLMSSGHKHLNDLTHLSFLVLDEADRMVKQGYFPELEKILEHIPLPKDEHAATRDEETEELTIDRAARVTKLHTYVFSATLTLPDSFKERLTRGASTGSKGPAGAATFDNLMNRIQFRGKPKVVDLTTDVKVSDRISEAYVNVSDTERDEMLYYLLALYPGRTLVFANAVSGVRRAAAILKLLGLPAVALHAQQQQRQRLRALDRFKASDQGILVATDVAARGLDVPNIRCVIQYQLPNSADTYIHRAGRTGRGTADGLCISFVVPSESSRFAALNRSLSREPLPHFPIDDGLMKLVHKRVRLAERIDKIERINRKGKADKDWMQRHSAEVGIDWSDDANESDSGDERQRGDSEAVVNAKLHEELSLLLAQPLQRRMSEKFFAGGASHAAANSVTSNAQDSAGAATVSSAAMSETLANAQLLGATRRAAGEKGKAGSSKKAKVLTLAEHRALSLEKAVNAKRSKKGKPTAIAGVVFGRAVHGEDALAAFKMHSGGN